MENQSRNHDVGFYGPTGVFIKVSYSGHLGISGYTGCPATRNGARLLRRAGASRESSVG